MSSNYFQGTIAHPHHISIGAVVKNSDGKICCHYFESAPHPSFGAFENLYLLMRETIEPNETIEKCLERGLREEFGMKAQLRSYLGPIVSHFPGGSTIEKTTLYFLCDFISQNESDRKLDDLESASTLQWLAISDLVEKMKEQGKRLGREDCDESAILERVII